MSLYEQMLGDDYLVATFDQEYMFVDAESARKCKCPHCNTNLEYEGYVMGNTSYRAFGVCPKCNYFKEI